MGIGGIVVVVGVSGRFGNATRGRRVGLVVVNMGKGKTGSSLLPGMGVKITLIIELGAGIARVLPVAFPFALSAWLASYTGAFPLGEFVSH